MHIIHTFIYTHIRPSGQLCIIFNKKKGNEGYGEKSSNHTPVLRCHIEKELADLVGHWLGR